jgi:hypothetical protein
LPADKNVSEEGSVSTSRLEVCERSSGMKMELVSIYKSAKTTIELITAMKSIKSISE